MKSNDAAFTRHLPVICREWTITVTILRLLLEILRELMNGEGKKRGGITSEAVWNLPGRKIKRLTTPNSGVEWRWR
jgi:hypothetical protein